MEEEQGEDSEMLDAMDGFDSDPEEGAAGAQSTTAASEKDAKVNAG